MGLINQGCRINRQQAEGAVVDVIGDTAAGLAGLDPAVVEAACQAWLEGPKAEFFPSAPQLRALAASAAPVPAVRVEPSEQPWQRYAETAVGALARCFVDRVRQLEPTDHERFGREVAAFARQWSLGEVHRHGRELENWVATWLGTTWWDLMGQPREPVKPPGGAWKGGA